MKYKIFYFLVAAFVFAPMALKAQVPMPAKKQEKPVVLLGGTAHIGDGTVLEDAVIVFESGKITTVEKAHAFSEAFADTTSYRVINTEGKHIYPGLILPNTNLGLAEVSAVRSTLDYEEVGSLNPNVRAIIAYNAESQLVPTLRYSGILLAQVTPQGGLISGSSSVVQLDAWNWEDAAVKEDGGIHLHWPNMFKRSGWWAEPGETKKNEDYDKHITELEKLFTEAAAYASVNDPAITNLKLEAMKGLFDGSKNLYVHANYGKEIIEGIQFAKKHEVSKVVLVGGEDALMARTFIKENNVPVLLANLHRLPNRTDADIDNPYKLASLLHQEGILVGLGYEGTMNARNLPFFAGTSVAYGLDKEEALRTITSNTAKILGIEDKVGTLEVGKEAYIVVSSGDLLDMRTNNVEYAFIHGREIILENHQQALYEKYKEKYAR